MVINGGNYTEIHHGEERYKLAVQSNAYGIFMKRR